MQACVLCEQILVYLVPQVGGGGGGGGGEEEEEEEEEEEAM